MKIFVAIKQFNPEAKRILEQIGEVEYGKGAINDCDAIIVGLDHIGREDIAAAPKLKLIASATTGLDHIDVDYAQVKGIKVVSLRGEDLKEITGTAELAFGLMLALVRHIPEAFNDVKGGNWNREEFLGHNLYGKTLGIVGLGRLGSLMAQYAKAFGMRVIAHDLRQVSSDKARLADFKTLLSESNVISIHVPLTDETEGMFNNDIFRQMKKTACLINTARGDIVNEVDLLYALKHQIIAGYAADVLTGETEFNKDGSSHPLIEYANKHSNLIITPHIGGCTVESRAATDMIIAEKVRDGFKKVF